VFDGITPILIEFENAAGWINRILKKPRMKPDNMDSTRHHA
jgi:hypothetical protein